MPEIPEPTILLYLQDAVQTEIADYVRAPGRRDHEREDIQNAAMAYIARRLHSLASPRTDQTKEDPS